MKKELTIAIPVYGALTAETALCLMALERSAPGKYHVITHLHDSLIPRARNTLAAMFLKTDAPRLLFIDADITFKPEDVERLARSHHDIVGGVYPIKHQSGNPRYCLTPLPGERRLCADGQGLAEVLHVGTGFMSISRGLLERMRDTTATPYRTADGEDRWDFFPCGVVNGQYLSEDYRFCDDARNLGARVYADLRVRLGHVGLARWPLAQNTAG